MDNRWFLNKDGEILIDEYGEYGFIAHSLILCNLSIYGYYYLHLDSIFSTLGFSHKGNSKQITKIKHMVDKMVEDDFITIGDIYGNELSDIDITNNTIYSCFSENPSSFLLMAREDVISISSYKGGRSINRFKLFTYYMYLRFEIANSGCKKIANSTIYKQLGLSDSTITNYNKILEDLKLICCCSSGFDTKNQKELINIYSTFADLPTLKKHMLDNYGFTYDELRLQKKERDLKRSIKLTIKEI